MKWHESAARVIGLAALAGAFATPAWSAQAPRGDYQGSTTQRLTITMHVNAARRLDFNVDLTLHCESGVRRGDPVQTDPTDHFTVNRRTGRFRVNQPFAVSASDAIDAPTGTAMELHSFTLKGRFVSSARVKGTMSDVVVFQDTSGKLLDRCRTGGQHFRASRQ